MPSQSSEDYLVPNEYPADIERLIGRITLICGQLDRLIIEALIRKGATIDRFELIGIVRNASKPLGAWEGRLVDPAIIGGITDTDWLDDMQEQIEEIKEDRNSIIHDALVSKQDGSFIWLSSSKDREHKAFNADEMKEQIERLEAFKDFVFGSEVDGMKGCVNGSPYQPYELSLPKE